MAKSREKSFADEVEEMIGELTADAEAWETSTLHVVVDPDFKDLVQDVTRLAQRLTKVRRIAEGILVRRAATKRLLEMKAFLEEANRRSGNPDQG